MFLKKLFKFGKDYGHYMEKGDRFLSCERFADARDAYADALARIEEEDGSYPSRVEEVRRKIAMTGNMLGRLNLVEAEHAIAGGDGKKAEEHLHIILELADDSTLRDKAEKMLAELGSDAPPAPGSPEADDCGGCAERSAETGGVEKFGMDDSISGEDRLALFFQTLPGDLPERYAGMGEEFGRGCLLNLEGDDKGAMRIFEELSADTGNDILEYEKALICYHRGDTGMCEQLLNRAIGLNPLNPLCHVGLVQLYTETGREPEALEVLEGMISSDLIPEQATMMQGDLLTLVGDETNAIESYSRLLGSPGFAGEAARRLAPLLESQGRAQEAAYLAKKFAKVCC